MVISGTLSKQRHLNSDLKSFRKLFVVESYLLGSNTALCVLQRLY